MSRKDPRIPQHVVHNDEPVFDPKHDHFGQKHLVETIAITLGHRTSPPFVASLNGDWGQGKTSILEAVYTQFTGVRPGAFTNQEPPPLYTSVRVVWFEAWRYQHDPTPIIALLNEIRKQLEKMSRFASLKKSVAKLTGIATQTILENELAVTAGLQLLSSATGQIMPFAGIGGMVSEIKRNGEAWENRNHSNALPSQTIRELLNKAIADILKVIVGNNEKQRLIIIIDDLDRCQPVVAYKLLEGLKIFLNLNSCSFLIGSNRKEIIRALKVGIQQESGGRRNRDDEDHAREYFEKLCSYCWDLPFPTRKQTAQYVEHLLKQCDSVTIPPLRKQLVKLIVDSDYRVLPGNPRRLKSFANMVSQVNHTGNIQNAEEITEGEPAFILSLAYVFAFLPDVQRQILAHPVSIRTLHVLSRASIREAHTEHDEIDPHVPPADDVLSKTVISGNALLHLAPDISGKFRMAPVMATLAGIPDSLINKYLPHALR